MMKQPAENTNATRTEAETASARALPFSKDSPEIRKEIAVLAYRYSQERESHAGTPEDDWFRAENVVHDRLKAMSTA